MGKEKPSQITEKQVVEMISDFEVSDRKMMKILRKMKQIFGKKAVTPNIKEAIIERKKKVLKFFKVENTTLRTKITMISTDNLYSLRIWNCFLIL